MQNDWLTDKAETMSSFGSIRTEYEVWWESYTVYWYILFYRKADIVCLRSDSGDVQTDLELHCLHTNPFSKIRLIAHLIRHPINKYVTLPLPRKIEPIFVSADGTTYMPCPIQLLFVTFIINNNYMYCTASSYY